MFLNLSGVFDNKNDHSLVEMAYFFNLYLQFYSLHMSDLYLLMFLVKVFIHMVTHTVLKIKKVNT